MPPILFIIWVLEPYKTCCQAGKFPLYMPAFDGENTHPAAGHERLPAAPSGEGLYFRVAAGPVQPGERRPSSASSRPSDPVTIGGRIGQLLGRRGQPAGMGFDGLASDWVVWSDERDKAVLAYRPDVFDGGEFPAPCMPTIYLTKGRRSRHPGRDARPDDPWHVTLYLEPDVDRDAETYDSRDEAVAGAEDLAARFAAGEVDYRDLYQVPRDRYLDKLDELTGRGD